MVPSDIEVKNLAVGDIVKLKNGEIAVIQTIERYIGELWLIGFEGCDDARMHCIDGSCAEDPIFSIVQVLNRVGKKESKLLSDFEKYLRNDAKLIDMYGLDAAMPSKEVSISVNGSDDTSKGIPHYLVDRFSQDHIHTIYPKDTSVYCDDVIAVGEKKYQVVGVVKKFDKYGLLSGVTLECLDDDC